MPENSCFKDCPHAERISSLEKDYEKMYEEKRAAHKEIYTALNSLKNDFAIACCSFERGSCKEMG